MSSEGGFKSFFKLKHVVLIHKVFVLRKAINSYTCRLCFWGGTWRYRGKEPGVRVPCNPCRRPVHLKSGEAACGCGVMTDASDGAAKHYWLMGPSDIPGHRCPACGEGCLMPHDWAVKMVKEKGL